MTCVESKRLAPPARGEKSADDRARQQKLQLRREPPGSMPTTATMKEFAPARPQNWKHVLEIWRGA
jgi:hypothetical protein